MGFKRKLKIAEYDENILQFIKNFVHPLKLKNITQEGEVVTMEGVDTNTKENFSPAS